MKHLVEGLEGALLDAAVAICEGYRFGHPQPRDGWVLYPLAVPGEETLGACTFENGEWSNRIKRYSRDWSHGGPIIERERINLNYRDDDVWQAHYNGRWAVFGPTPLVAAMRAFVACRYGEWINLPEGLTVGPSRNATVLPARLYDAAVKEGIFSADNPNFVRLEHITNSPAVPPKPSK